MKKNIEIKSVLIGVFIGIVAMLAMGASSSQTSAVDRYRLGAAGSHGLVIDTVTGQVWTKYFPQNGGRADSDFAKPKLE